MKHYLEEQADDKAFASGQRGNSTAKDTRIPSTKQVQQEVRDFVRKNWSKRQRVTARQVVDFLYEKNYIFIKKEDDKYEKKSL